MKTTSKRWVAMLLLAAITFAQASVSFASCTIERGALAQAIASQPAEPCEHDPSMTQFEPQQANWCVAHCTADLQMPGFVIAIVRSPAGAPVLTVSAADPAPTASSGLETPPVGTPPLRILLHSFLI